MNYGRKGYYIIPLGIGVEGDSVITKNIHIRRNTTWTLNTFLSEHTEFSLIFIDMLAGFIT
jgi:hypothetical protein